MRKKKDQLRITINCKKVSANVVKIVGDLEQAIYKVASKHGYDTGDFTFKDSREVIILNKL